MKQIKVKIQALLLVLICFPGLVMANVSAGDKLTTLQFNIWLDSTKVDGGLGLTADQIVAADADIVSLIEVKNFEGDYVESLKQALKQRGQHYYGSFAGDVANHAIDADTAILSRFPVVEQTIVYRTEENSIVRSLIDRNGQLLAAYSVHLEYRYYTCYLPRGYNSGGELYPGWDVINNNSDGKPEPVTDLAAIRKDNIASTRADAISRLLTDASSLRQQGIPVIVMGDFNEPSALDWTPEMADLFDHNGLVYRWDTTAKLMDAGYIDSYRELYPNPVTHPGFTWPAAAKGIIGSAKKTSWAPLSDERDRIDFTFYQGEQLQAIDAWLVGTPVTVVRNAFNDEAKETKDKFSLKANQPWPSDHRAVQTVFKLSM